MSMSPIPAMNAAPSAGPRQSHHAQQTTILSARPIEVFNKPHPTLHNAGLTRPARTPDIAVSTRQPQSHSEDTPPNEERELNSRWNRIQERFRPWALLLFLLIIAELTLILLLTLKRGVAIGFGATTCVFVLILATWLGYQIWRRVRDRARLKSIRRSSKVGSILILPGDRWGVMGRGATVPQHPQESNGNLSEDRVQVPDLERGESSYSDELESQRKAVRPKEKDQASRSNVHQSRMPGVIPVEAQQLPDAVASKPIKETPKQGEFHGGWSQHPSHRMTIQTLSTSQHRLSPPLQQISKERCRDRRQKSHESHSPEKGSQTMPKLRHEFAVPRTPSSIGPPTIISSDRIQNWKEPLFKSPDTAPPRPDSGLPHAESSLTQERMDHIRNRRTHRDGVIMAAGTIPNTSEAESSSLPRQEEAVFDGQGMDIGRGRDGNEEVTGNEEDDQDPNGPLAKNTRFSWMSLDSLGRLKDKISGRKEDGEI